MENQLDQLKKELVQEIKELATEIAKSNSFVGLLSQEIKFKTLHEKLINLKFLDRKHIGLDVFDQPIPMQEEKDEVYSTSEERYEDEVAQEYNFDREEVEFDVSPDKSKISNDFKENVMEFSNHRIEEIEAGIEPKDFTSTTHDNHEEKEEVYFELPETEDEFADEETKDVEDESIEEVEEKHIQTFDEEIAAYAVDDFEDFLPKHSSLPKIQIDFNDRIAFLNQLFDGDSEGMDLVFNTLNHLETISDSKAYLKDLIKEMDWSSNDEYIDRLEELVHKRFD